MSDYDIFGNIAVIKGEGKTKTEKLKQAQELVKKPGITTVLEKATNVHGRLRTIKTKHLLGRKTLIALLKENGCMFKLNIESCYFSPRLSNERQLISGKIKSSDRVLVMFAGVGVYPIVIYKYSHASEIIGVEIGRECCRYFKENLGLNKIPDGRIGVIQGDVKKKVNSKLGKFDVVIMARPNLSDSFLKWGFSVCKKNTKLFYYGFCRDNEVKKMLEEIQAEAKKYKKKIKIIEAVPAGEIAPYKHRYRVEIKLL